ncbi:Fibronectin domain-containing protein, partial [Oryctes borbonicus]
METKSSITFVDWATDTIQYSNQHIYTNALVTVSSAVYHQGSDLCRQNTHFKNERRLMSNGWLVIKPKESTTIINNLVPFTYYTVTFTDPIYGLNKTIFPNTDPTDLPVENEIPKFIVSPKIKEVAIVIPPPQCDVTYGKIFYRFEKIGQSNPRVVIDEPNLTLKNLEPYTNYTLTVQVARSINKLNDSGSRITVYYNFTTKPQVAPPLEFVELYEISETIASFRYKLPEKANGQPALVGINACSKITRCNLEMFNITRCNLWKDLYCVTISNLAKRLNYTFKLSIKNNGTNAFGGERNIISKTEDKVPGTPVNLSYTITDCSKHIEVCNVNISWSHPYNQSGVITSFEIFLVGTGAPIVETVLIHNREYKPTYWHAVKYLVYGSTYNVSVRACNLVHKGLAASLDVQIDHIGQHVDQEPKLLQMNQEVVTFQLPKLDRRLNSSTIIVVVQQYDNEKSNLPQNLIFATNGSLCLQKGTSWVAGAWQMSYNDETNITIGDNAEMILGIINAVVINKPLLPKTNYCVNFIAENIFKDTKYVEIYHKDHIALPDIIKPLEISRTNTNISIITIVLVGILILTIVIFVGIFYIRRKQGRRRTLSDGEHIYEAMPNEDDNDTFNV